MKFLNEIENQGKKVVPHVARDRCDGCAFCVDACPRGCLSVVPSQQRKGKKIIFIEPRDCDGCGICQGTCPKEAIFIPGLSNDNIREYVDAAIICESGQ